MELFIKFMLLAQKAIKLRLGILFGFSIWLKEIVLGL